MNKANIVLDKKVWEKKLKKPEIYFKKKLNKLSKLSTFKNKNQEFTVMLTNNKKMKDLNLKFRNKNVSTDVLSFPLKVKLKNKLYLGDIAISFEIINKRAKSTSFDHELDKMWIHGFLHLLGHDHIKNKDYFKMLREENFIYKHVKSKMN